MPRPRRTPTQVEAANSFIASAANLSVEKQLSPTHAGVTEWQKQLWYMYDTVGEYRFGASWKSQCLSRVKLVVTEDQPDGGTKTITDGPEVEALDIMFGGDAGQAQGMGQMGLHLEVAGETWLVGEVVGGESGVPEEDQWTIYSNEELTPKGTGGAGPRSYEIDRGNGKKRTIRDDEAVVIRLWRSHPRKWIEADSPGRASLSVLRLIEQMEKRTAAQIDSRLAGAGILFLPTEMTFATPGADGSVAADVDKFMADLQQAMLAPLGDRGVASAMVPLVAKAPGALIDKIKHVTFASPLDDKGREQMEAYIRRLATNADMPAEVLLGMGDSNHWSAWQIDESGLKAHIEPTAEVITAGLTSRWLPSAVKALGATVNPMRRINFDTSDLRLRPDHSAQAVDGYDRLELSGKTLRRETGFEESDAPTPAELQDMLLRKLVADPDPKVRVAAIHALVGQSVPIPGPDEVGTDPTPPPAIEAPAPTEAPPQGRRAIPNEDDAQAASAGLLAAAELLVDRAVERANNRTNNRGKVRRPCPPDKLDAALVGAWDSVPRTAERLGIDAEWLTSALDTYTRAVLTEGVEHQPGVLVRLLSTHERQRVAV